MKIKPTTKPGHVVVELSRRDDTLLTQGAGGTAPAAVFGLKTVLVPTDFSACSQKALQYAILFARQFDARLLLLHVTPVSYPAAGDLGAIDLPALERDLHAGAEEELAALVRREIKAPLQARTLVRTGRAAQEIVAAAAELEADLIVIATHGHTGLRHVLLGSTAESVVRRAPCPVLTVREHEHEFATT